MNDWEGTEADNHTTVLLPGPLFSPYFVQKALKVLGKELSIAAKEGTIHRILVFSETKKGCDEV